MTPHGDIDHLSTLVQEMACCLTSPNHYLSKYLHIIHMVPWYSSNGNFTRVTSGINHSFGLLYVMFTSPIRIFYRAVPGFAIDCSCYLHDMARDKLFIISSGVWGFTFYEYMVGVSFLSPRLTSMIRNLQAKVSATFRLFGGDSSHTPFFDWQGFQGNTLYPLAIIHMVYINVLGFDDKFERDLCFFIGNLGIIFNSASAQLFSAQGEMVIGLGQRSPTGQWWQRLIDADWMIRCPGIMMTSSDGNIFRVIGPLCGEFTGHLWIPLTKASDAELRSFGVFFDMRLNKRLSKHSRHQWFETPSRSF